MGGKKKKKISPIAGLHAWCKMDAVHSEDDATVQTMPSRHLCPNCWNWSDRSFWKDTKNCWSFFWWRSWTWPASKRDTSKTVIHVWMCSVALAFFFQKKIPEPCNFTKFSQSNMGCPSILCHEDRPALCFQRRTRTLQNLPESLLVLDSHSSSFLRQRLPRFGRNFAKLAQHLQDCAVQSSSTLLRWHWADARSEWFGVRVPHSKILLWSERCFCFYFFSGLHDSENCRL